LLKLYFASSHEAVPFSARLPEIGLLVHGAGEHLDGENAGGSDAKILTTAV
jgi:hypothetical protein